MKTEGKTETWGVGRGGPKALSANGLHERLFAMLDERYRRILFENCVNMHGWQAASFHESTREWNEFLVQHGMEFMVALEEWRMYKGVVRHIRWVLRRESEIIFVSDPRHELGIRLGLLTTNHRFLKMDGELAMRILALGLP